MAPENENENGGESTEETVEVAEEIAEEIVDAIEDETPAETDVDVTVIEAPEPEPTEAKFSTVDVGDLHISGPAELVESLTATYLKDHIDHNPHNGPGESVVEELATDITPDIIEEQIEESVEGETVDAPPQPADWLFRSRR